MKFENFLHASAIHHQKYSFSHVTQDNKMPLDEIKQLLRPRVELHVACHNLFNSENFRHTKGSQAHAVHGELSQRRFQHSEGKKSRKKKVANGRRNKNKRTAQSLRQRYKNLVEIPEKIEKYIRDAGGILVHEPIGDSERTWSFINDKNAPVDAIAIHDVNKSLAYASKYIDRMKLEKNKRDLQPELTKNFKQNFAPVEEQAKLAFVKDAVLIKQEVFKDILFKNVFEQIVKQGPRFHVSLSFDKTGPAEKKFKSFVNKINSLNPQEKHGLYNLSLDLSGKADACTLGNRLLFSYKNEANQAAEGRKKNRGKERTKEKESVEKVGSATRLVAFGAITALASVGNLAKDLLTDEMKFTAASISGSVFATKAMTAGVKLLKKRHIGELLGSATRMLWLGDGRSTKKYGDQLMGKISKISSSVTTLLESTIPESARFGQHDDSAKMDNLKQNCSWIQIGVNLINYAKLGKQLHDIELIETNILERHESSTDSVQVKDIILSYIKRWDKSYTIDSLVKLLLRKDELLEDEDDLTKSSEEDDEFYDALNLVWHYVNNSEAKNNMFYKEIRSDLEHAIEQQSSIPHDSHEEQVTKAINNIEVQSMTKREEVERKGRAYWQTYMKVDPKVEVQGVENGKNAYDNKFDLKVFHVPFKRFSSKKFCFDCVALKKYILRNLQHLTEGDVAMFQKHPTRVDETKTWVYSCHHVDKKGLAHDYYFTENHLDPLLALIEMGMENGNGQVIDDTFKVRLEKALKKKSIRNPAWDHVRNDKALEEEAEREGISESNTTFSNLNPYAATWKYKQDEEMDEYLNLSFIYNALKHFTIYQTLSLTERHHITAEKRDEFEKLHLGNENSIFNQIKDKIYNIPLVGAQIRKMSSFVDWMAQHAVITQMCYGALCIVSTVGIQVLCFGSSPGTVGATAIHLFLQLIGPQILKLSTSVASNGAGALGPKGASEVASWVSVMFKRLFGDNEFINAICRVTDGMSAFAMNMAPISGAAKATGFALQITGIGVGGAGSAAMLASSAGLLTLAMPWSGIAIGAATLGPLMTTWGNSVSKVSVFGAFYESAGNTALSILGKMGDFGNALKQMLNMSDASSLDLLIMTKFFVPFLCKFMGADYSTPSESSWLGGGCAQLGKILEYYGARLWLAKFLTGVVIDVYVIKCITFNQPVPAISSMGACTGHWHNVIITTKRKGAYDLKNKADDHFRRWGEGEGNRAQEVLGPYDPDTNTYIHEESFMDKIRTRKTFSENKLNNLATKKMGASDWNSWAKRKSRTPQKDTTEYTYGFADDFDIADGQWSTVNFLGGISVGIGIGIGAKMLHSNITSQKAIEKDDESQPTSQKAIEKDDESQPHFTPIYRQYAMKKSII